MRIRLVITVLVMLVLGCPGEAAESYPAKSVTIIVPAPLGGGMDLLARTLADKLSTDLKHPFIIENKPGANGEVGARYVAGSLPNGYTLLLTNPFVDTTSGFNYATDLLAIAPASELPIAIGINPKLPVHSLAELISLAKAQPGKLSYASPGVGSPQHIVAQMVGRVADIDWIHVPYGGSGDAVRDIVGGYVPVGFLGYAAFLPFLPDGRVRLLATAEEKRLAIDPDLPIVSETLPGVAQSAWFALLAPRGTADPIIQRIRGAVELAMADKTVKDRLAPAGFVPFHLEHGTIVDFMIKQSALRKKLKAGTNHPN